MNSSTAIQIEQLSKKFCKNLRRTMAYGLIDIAKAGVLPHIRKNQQTVETLRHDEFWALRDVSFEVPQGQCWGIIGHNGAGKSTLFSILSGIYGPTQGRVAVRGHLQALIALGAGFHPMLTGRENIYINAAILGMKTKEIDKIFDHIVEFSELSEFIDMPIKNYSSGMLARLGFSVAVHMNPEILLVDEVLAVGDIAFQNKSFERMQQLLKSGITIVFVSHSLHAIESICSNVVWLDHGVVKMTGSTESVLPEYIKDMQNRQKSSSPADERLFPIRISSVELLDQNGNPRTEFNFQEPVRLRFHYECSQEIRAAYFTFTVARSGQDRSAFAWVSMVDDGLDWKFQPGQGVVECLLHTKAMAPGAYRLTCSIARTLTATIGQKYYQDWFPGGQFWIRGTAQDVGYGNLPANFLHTMPPILLERQWTRSGNGSV